MQRINAVKMKTVLLRSFQIADKNLRGGATSFAAQPMYMYLLFVPTRSLGGSSEANWHLIISAARGHEPQKDLYTTRAEISHRGERARPHSEMSVWWLGDGTIHRGGG